MKLHVLDVLHQVALVVRGVDAQLNHLVLQLLALGLQVHLPETMLSLILLAVPETPPLVLDSILRLKHSAVQVVIS